MNQNKIPVYLGVNYSIQHTAIGDVAYTRDGFIYFGPNYRYGFSPSFRSFLYGDQEMWPLTPAMATAHEVAFDHMLKGIKSGACQEQILRTICEKTSTFGGIEDENEEEDLGE